MSEHLRKRVNVPRIPKRLYASGSAQQKIIQKGLSSSNEAATQAANEAIAKMAAKAEAPLFGRASRIAAGMGRVGGLAGRAARIAASAEGGVAAASAGLLYGMGGHLLEEYQHKKATKKLRTEGYQEISGEGVKVIHTNPGEASRYSEASLSSSGSHRVAHKHGEGKKAESLLPGKPSEGKKAEPVQVKSTPAEPVQVKSTPAEPIQVKSAPTEPEKKSRFEISRDTLGVQAQIQPIHGFRISRNRPYNLIDWERGARAKAMLLGGTRG